MSERAGHEARMGARARWRILVVDDDRESRVALTMLLKAYGYRVVAAADGAEAVDEVRAHPPDLILMDLMMPVMDGLEATRRIRSQADMADVPIVCLSASHEAAALARREQGIDSFLPKPIDVRALERGLGRWLGDGPPFTGSSRWQD